jgi:CheY-like chemotaxis protein
MEETPTGAESRARGIVLGDEQVIAKTLAIILTNAGFEARATFSGEKAVKLLETFPPDVLIADVIMPGMTGIDAAIVVRNRLPRCRILLFSGQAATSDARQGSSSSD